MTRNAPHQSRVGPSVFDNQTVERTQPLPNAFITPALHACHHGYFNLPINGRRAFKRVTMASVEKAKTNRKNNCCRLTMTLGLGLFDVLAKVTFWNAVFKQWVGFSESFSNLGPSGINKDFRRLVIEVPKISRVVETRNLWHNNLTFRSLIKTRAETQAKFLFTVTVMGV